MDKRTPTPPTAANPNPSTPQRVLDIVSDAELQSTPSNRGSASASEHLTSVLVDDVSPSILADIKNHATCTVEALLNYLLSLSLPEEHKHTLPANLLDQCIDAVLPICNAHPVIICKGKQKRVDGETDVMRLRTYLTEYCKYQRLEVAGYQPFVAFNHALRALHNIDVPLRKSTDLRLLFHRNDPKLITTTHNGHQSKRKPDIVLSANSSMKTSLLSVALSNHILPRQIYDNKLDPSSSFVRRYKTAANNDLFSLLRRTPTTTSVCSWNLSQIVERSNLTHTATPMLPYSTSTTVSNPPIFTPDVLASIMCCPRNCTGRNVDRARTEALILSSHGQGRMEGRRPVIR